MNELMVGAQLAFLCTGPSDGFDPICNPTHTVILGLALLAGLTATVWAVVMLARRWLRARRAAGGDGVLKS